MATVVKENDMKAKDENVIIEQDRHGLYGLHVRNIPSEIKEDNLCSLFKNFGYIKRCRIMKTEDNFQEAFVKFAKHHEAVEAMRNIQGTRIGDSVIVIRPAFDVQMLKGRSHCKKNTGSSKEEMLEKQRCLKKQNSTVDSRAGHNEELYILPSRAQDVRYSASDTYVPTVCRSSSGKNCAQSQTVSKCIETSNGGNTVQIHNSLPKRNCVPNGLAQGEIMLNKSTNLGQISVTPRASYAELRSNVSSVFSNGSYSVPTRGTYQNYPVISPRSTSENFHSNQQNGTHFGANSIYSPSLQYFTKSDNLYSTHNGSVSPNRNPTLQISKDMNDLKISARAGTFHHCNPDVSKWSVADVIMYFNTQEKCSKSMTDFLEEQEIDGNALMLLEQESLLHFMKLGPALKLLNMREKLKHQSSFL